jgi:hypothetical protein
MLGIDDPFVLLAYLGCIVMAGVCVVYGVVRRNAAADDVTQEDRAWAIDDKRVEDETAV